MFSAVLVAQNYAAHRGKGPAKASGGCRRFMRSQIPAARIAALVRRGEMVDIKRSAPA